MAAPPRLLCVGHASIDHHFEVDALALPPAKVPAHRHMQRVGGMSSNAAVAAARLGARVAFAGPVGDDAGAPLIAAHFAAEGVEPRGLVRVPGAATSVSAVIVDAAGERLIVNHRGNALERAPRFEPGWLADIDLLLADPRCVDWAATALTAARERGILTLLDADIAPRADLRRLVPLADWVVFSEPGLRAYSDAPAPAALGEALGGGAGAAVVTCGERGQCWLARGAVLRELPAFEVAPVVDTTAAGDVFHAALGLALAEGRDAAAALRFASAAAALKCLHPGGVAGAPRRAEVDALLAAR